MYSFCKTIFGLFLVSVLVIIFSSCAGTRKIPTVSFDEYAMTKPAKSVQKKSNITIEVEPLSPSKLYDYPELFSFDPDNLEGFSVFNVMKYFPKDNNGKSWCYTFGQGRFVLTAFKVNITNKTPHILRMKNARIYLVVEGQEPIAAVTKMGNSQLYNVGEEEKVLLPKSAIDGDESLIHWITFFEKKYENERPKGLISLDYPIGIASQVIAANKSNYKLINDVSKEILPDFSYEGILLFPNIVSNQNVKLMFYDITTKTDAAGNPIEKTKFTFNLKKQTVDMWFDKAAKRWREGAPPTTTGAKN